MPPHFIDKEIMAPGSQGAAGQGQDRTATVTEWDLYPSSNSKSHF